MGIKRGPKKIAKSLSIESINIKNLFEIFDYNINLKDENILLITGPNGYGKTQILNILYNLFNRNFIFFQYLVFDKITVNLNDDITIEVQKKEIKTKSNTEKNNSEINIIFKKKKETIENYIFNPKIDDRFFRHLPVSRLDKYRWLNDDTLQELSIEEVIEEFSDSIPIERFDYLSSLKTKLANDILDSIDIHLIREQRLFQKVNRGDNRPYDRGKRDEKIMSATIQAYSKELKNLINDKIQQSFTKSQNLDSSFPNRLIKEKREFSESDYNNQFASLKEKQKKLNKYGLYESKQEELAYSKDVSKTLLVYLNDLEKKLQVFDDLLEKLELFTSILNERRFTFKTIHVNSKEGFYFKTTKEKVLKLNKLSSGEQHEVVLLYELIFKTKPNILVLIDEPEISLHINWQKDFVNDLLRIIKIQNFQVLIATHSPSIINDKWDLVFNLQKAEVND